MGQVTQGGLSNMFSGGGGSGNYSDDDRIGGIQSSLSNLMGGGNSNSSYDNSSGDGIYQDHPLVQPVQQETGIQDPQIARQYTQHALNLMNEHTNNNPQGMHSLFSNLLGGL